MGEVIVEKGEVLKVYFVCATAVQSQLFSFADLFLSQTKLICTLQIPLYGPFFPTELLCTHDV